MSTQGRGAAPRLVGVVACLALTLGAWRCGENDTRLRRAARASDAIAQGIATLLQATIELYGAGALREEEAKALGHHLWAANEALEKFNAKAKALERVDPANQRLLALWFADVAETLNELNRQGVLPVRNEEARHRLAVIFAGLQGSAEFLVQLFAEK